MQERGATRAQVTDTITSGRPAPAKFGRRRFRKTFPFNAEWNGTRYARKTIDAFAAKMSYGWLVVTVVVRYF
jgi:hypothetical protein